MASSSASADSWITPGRLALGFALAKLVLHLTTLGSYGYFRDELYYLACTDRLAWGYVDHPPFSIAVLALWRALFGDALEVLHVLPAIVGAAIVLVTGRLAIALGGGRLAVLLACTAVLTSPARIGVDHNVSMNGIDALFWVTAALFTVRAQSQRRMWVPLGAVLGLGLLNKWSMLWFGAGLAVAIVATPWRSALRTPGPYVAAAVALVLFAPHLRWQMQHGWPTLEFMRNALASKYVRLSPLAYAREVFLLAGPASAPIWLAGTIAPFRSLKAARPLVIVFLVTLAIVGITRGKPEYLLASLPIPWAIGAVAFEKMLTGRSRVIVPGALAAAQVALAAVALPFALPVLNVDRFVAYSQRLGVAPSSTEKKELGVLPQFYADMHGWPELVSETLRAWNKLSPEEREHGTIWAVSGGYGPAAAIDVLGADVGLPHAIAGHNNYWLWGWGHGDGRAVVMLGGPRERLATLFERFEQIGTVRCAPCMPYEDEKPVYVGRGMKRPFADIWDAVKHYD